MTLTPNEMKPTSWRGKTATFPAGNATCPLAASPAETGSAFLVTVESFQRKLQNVNGRNPRTAQINVNWTRKSVK